MSAKSTPEQRAAERLQHQYTDEWLKDAIKPPNHPSRYEEYKDWNSFSNKQRSEIASIIAAEFADEREQAQNLIIAVKNHIRDNQCDCTLCQLKKALERIEA